MSKDPAGSSEQWATEWLTAVANGTLTMSQRKLSSVLAHAGNVETIREVAVRLLVHLAIVVDDHGDELVVASVHPIRVLC